MRGYLALGIYAGVVIGLLLIIVILKVSKNDGSMKCKYDERQAHVRGKGYKISFFTLVVYNLIYGSMGLVMDKLFLDSWTAMVIGICLAGAVYVVYCIWYDAYFSLNENRGRLLFIFGIIGISNLILGSIKIISGEAVTDGVLNFQSSNFICGLLFIIIFIAILAKKIKTKSEME